MPHAAAASMATRERAAGRYQRHRPEQTLLYRIVDEYYPAFAVHLAEQGRELPGYVQREFEDYLKCGRLEHGFLRVRCESCHATWLPSVGRSCASMLVLDGVYVDHPNGTARFRWVKASTSQELTQLAHTIAHRVGRFLERQGLLERDADDCMDAGGRATQGAVAENSYLASGAGDDDPMTPLLGHSITYRIAVGPQAGRKVFTLQTLPACDEPFDDGVGKVAGFSLHAGVTARAQERRKLERLCRFISRPAVSEKRLSLKPNGNIRYQLKTPYRYGTTHVIFEPLDFIARLAALVPKPRVNLTRPWCVCAEQQAPSVGHAGKAGQGQQA